MYMTATELYENKVVVNRRDKTSDSRFKEEQFSSMEIILQEKDDSQYTEMLLFWDTTRRKITS